MVTRAPATRRIPKDLSRTRWKQGPLSRHVPSKYKIFIVPRKSEIPPDPFGYNGIASTRALWIYYTKVRPKESLYA